MNISHVDVQTDSWDPVSYGPVYCCCSRRTQERTVNRPKELSHQHMTRQSLPARKNTLLRPLHKGPRLFLQGSEVLAAVIIWWIRGGVVGVVTAVLAVVIDEAVVVLVVLCRRLSGSGARRSSCRDINTVNVWKRMRPVSTRSRFTAGAFQQQRDKTLRELQDNEGASTVTWQRE